MAAKRGPNRDVFEKHQRLLKQMCDTLAEVGAVERDSAERIKEEISAWSPRYFSDDMMAARRMARATGTVLEEAGTVS